MSHYQPSSTGLVPSKSNEVMERHFLSNKSLRFILYIKYYPKIRLFLTVIFFEELPCVHIVHCVGSLQVGCEMAPFH